MKPMAARMSTKTIIQPATSTAPFAQVQVIGDGEASSWKLSQNGYVALDILKVHRGDELDNPITCFDANLYESIRHDHNEFRHNFAEFI